MGAGRTVVIDCIGPFSWPASAIALRYFLFQVPSSLARVSLRLKLCLVVHSHEGWERQAFRSEFGSLYDLPELLGSRGGQEGVNNCLVLRPVCILVGTSSFVWNRAASV